MRFPNLIFILILSTQALNAQSGQIALPKNLVQGYPRIYITQREKASLVQLIKDEPWAGDVLQSIHHRVDPHVERYATDPEWLVSRLMMYWKTKATNVYVNGVYYSHADGEAPVPTVRFTGARDYTTDYAMPALEDIVPYMDDKRGLYLQNKAKEGNPMEWVEQSKTGGIIHRHNQRIIRYARDAAFLYWLEDDGRFAKFAYNIFDTYMMGMYYRREPIDLLNGHIQTLVGLTCFQVIHESTLTDIAELYDFLHSYIERESPEKIVTYDETIKKWNDQIIKNGVPQNNWNLHQAKIILKAAMVLRDNKYYNDGKGREYYINHILNVNSPRQWSLTKFMDYGYDKNTGVWAECPGYSFGVTRDLTEFIRDFDNSFDHNLLPYMKTMRNAVKVLPQYLFPNGQTVAFGDSNYGPLNTSAIAAMIRSAQKNGDHELEKEFTAMYGLFENKGEYSGSSRSKVEISSFFEDQPLKLDPKYMEGDPKEYISQTFYAPNVSWHVQRIGEGREGLMVSLNASLGNHMHANGINMELYGAGFVQGADPGKGAGYLQPIYLEYYSQFPAHNTVMVDGASSYTEMLSYHAFDLIGEYPRSGQKKGFYEGITYSDVYFLEPETQSDQNRSLSIIKTGEHSGYYVDIFRSRKQRGSDKFHDYYYHNLGQSMQITDSSGQSLDLTPSEEMGFAGGHLYALDYMWDKRSARTNEDYLVQWEIDQPDGVEDVFMNLWMQGTEGREVFSIKSPPNKAFRDNGGLPYEVGKEPYLTFAARQHGEAWRNPFVSIYEPFTSEKGSSIQRIEGFEDVNGNDEFVGLRVTQKSGREDLIFSSYSGAVVSYEQISTDSRYAVVGSEQNGNLILFLGNGKLLSAKGYSINAETKGNVILEEKEGQLFLHNDVSIVIDFKRLSYLFDPGPYRAIVLRK